MKGLLIKDFCLLRNQRKILPVYIMLAVWFTAMHNDGFGFPYMMMMASILTISTISYDEVDHSLTHLFTLPFERKTYVTEKFLLGGILMAASLVFAIACCLVRTLISPAGQGTDLGTLILFSICAGAMIVSLMIPIRIRFGGDQGRIILYAIIAGIALIVLLITKVAPDQQTAVTAFFAQLGQTGLLLLAAGIAVIITVVGYILGVRWMKKKEF